MHKKQRTNPTAKTTRDILFLACIWLFSLLIINPKGNFPLNDDWSYGLTVKHLVETGEFRPGGWTSMPLLTQALWGALFCLLKGFSFEALRLSTLVLSFAGLCGIYLLIREIHRARSFALAAALTIGFNPIYCSLSNTFMTDVPFTAMTIFSLLFFVRYLKHEKTSDWLWGLTLAITAMLTRQLGIAVPMAFAVSLLLKRGFSKRNILRAIIPILLCVSALLLFDKWMAATDRTPVMYAQKSIILSESLKSQKMFLHIFKNMFIFSLYCGLFFWPLLIFFFTPPSDKVKRRISPFIVISFIIISAAVISQRNLMPLSGNIFTSKGVGPLLLRDTYILKTNHVPPLPWFFWFIVTEASFIGAILLALILGNSVIKLRSLLTPGRIKTNTLVGFFALLSAGLYMAPLLIISPHSLFDRYLLPVLPFIAMGLASVSTSRPKDSALKTKRTASLATAILLGLFFFFSVSATRDYLTWNRARWMALNNLVEKGRVKPKYIDGGFEFNGWYLYDAHYRNKHKKSWWWVDKDIYMITFGPVPGYSVIEKYRYHQWIPPREKSIFVLEKNLNTDHTRSKSRPK